VAPPQGAFSVGSQDSPPSDPQEAEGGVNAGVNPTSTPPTAPRKGSPPAVQLFSVPTGFVAPCCSVVMSTSQRPAAHGAHPSRTTGRDAPGALTGIPGSATALAAASPDVFGKTVMSRENGTTAQGPKTHAAASSESMGQWRGARQAVQPPHTLWPGNQAISDGQKSTDFDSVEIAPRFFFLPLIYPATPFRAGVRHSRFRRTVFQPHTSFWVGHRQLKLSATKPTSRFAHTFHFICRQKRGLGQKISIFQALRNTYLATTPG
jgi:hypothetical protein